MSEQLNCLGIHWLISKDTCHALTEFYSSQPRHAPSDKLKMRAIATSLSNFSVISSVILLAEPSFTSALAVHRSQQNTSSSRECREQMVVEMKHTFRSYIGRTSRKMSWGGSLYGVSKIGSAFFDEARRNWTCSPSPNIL